MRGPMTADAPIARARALRVVAAGAIAAALVLGACGSDDDGDEPASPLEDPAVTEASPEAPTPQPPPGDGSLTDQDEQEVTVATRAYIAAINSGDGERLCALLVPGALGGVRLPRPGADCPASVQGSIGYRGPGGTPAWKRTKLFELDAVAVQQDRARVTATVAHDFAGREQPSVEEDVIYLDRAGDSWLIAKPSASFYRAIGYPEPPLHALTPP